MNLPLLLGALLLYVADVGAQGCSNTCPPRNDLGIPQSSLCEGNMTAAEDTAEVFKTCYGNIPSFKLSDFKGNGRVTVISNYYFGCNAGRRESGVFAHIAQRLYDEHPNRVMFVASNKGASCVTWANTMASDAHNFYPNFRKPEDMPIVMDDTDSILRDLLFTPPFGHPSYVVFDGDLKVRHKFIGPCCGKSGYYDCEEAEAKSLNDELTGLVEAILNEDVITDAPSASSIIITPVPSRSSTENTLTPSGPPTKTMSTPTDPPTKTTPTPTNSCEAGDWSDWSGCSITCGSEDSGIEFRWRIVKDTRSNPYDSNNTLAPCPNFVETKPCTPLKSICESTCTAEIGAGYTVIAVAEEFKEPRDIAFHPTPGYHLGEYSEGRNFSTKNLGDGEAWVLNSYNHSVSIVSAVRSESQTVISRRDRGYYHYMINATALSFNSVGDSGRKLDRDSFNYWAVCNDNLNTYLGTKEPNYFMGPTLYDSSPRNFNTVNRLGKPCEEFEQCFFLHSDMLHEAPACIGIAHDPEVRTAFGNVYWAFDATGNGENGQLVRFDFQQPHGPGSMDHSIAAVRRYPEVKLHRGDLGMHAGIVVHPTRREIFISNPGDSTIIVVGADTGSFARIAREEYPIYSNRLPSFDYSIWECVKQRVFASDIHKPSGMALSNDGERLYVAEHDSGRILVYEVSSATILHIIQTGLTSIEGMAMSPNSNMLYFVDSKTNTLNVIRRNKPCNGTYTTRVMEEYSSAIDVATEEFEEKVGPDIFYVHYDNECIIETVIPNVTYFDQVHNDTGYASNDTDVQGPSGMDGDAYLLANRTDCGYNDGLNFDALLLGGFYCHPCLPITNGAMCDEGGTCQNVQWAGYTCDNHFIMNSNSMILYDSSGVLIEPQSLKLDPDVTYRFDISGNMTSYLSLDSVEKKALPFPGNPCGCTKNGSLLFKPSDLIGKPQHVYIRTLENRAVKLFINFEKKPSEPPKPESPSTSPNKPPGKLTPSESPTTVESSSSEVLFVRQLKYCIYAICTLMYI